MKKVKILWVCLSIILSLLASCGQVTQKPDNHPNQSYASMSLNTSDTKKATSQIANTKKVATQAIQTPKPIEEPKPISKVKPVSPPPQTKKTTAPAKTTATKSNIAEPPKVSTSFKTYEKSFEEQVEYVGNSNTKKFHLKSCSSVDKILPSNVVIFKSIEEALNSGYVPCKRCNPH